MYCTDMQGSISMLIDGDLQNEGDMHIRTTEKLTRSMERRKLMRYATQGLYMIGLQRSIT